MTKIWLAAGMTVMLMVASCGGGAMVDPAPGTALNTGIVEGYITEADIARGTSATDDGIPDVEVWCEKPGTGQRLGWDTTDENGHYRIEGLPVGEELMFKFQYQHANQHGNQEQVDIEGEQQIKLQTRDQLRVDAGICEFDNDGDGTPDDVDCDNDQLQVRLRSRDHGAGMA